MQVQLLNYTRNPEEMVAQAARLCYSAKTIKQIELSILEQKPDKIIEKIIKLGHYSVLEHASFTFGIEGLSRVTSHQLVRHRIASYSQKSQRYVKAGERENFIIPKNIQDNHDLAKEYKKLFVESLAFYQKMLSQNIPAEDARYILPQAMVTSIIFTANARELIHFFRMRCCTRAQWEIRELAISMLNLVKKVAPNIFQNSGPACLIGACPEGEMTCGKPWNKSKGRKNQ